MPKKPKTKKIKDTDYLTISARIRGMENTLMNRDKMEQLLETHSDEEVSRILQEYGYPAFSLADPEELDEAFSNVRRNIWKDLEQSMPDPRYLDVFRMKYDYHNVKAVLKAEAMHTSPDSMLSDLGRIPAEEVKRYVSSRGTEGELPPILAEASREARQVLESTRDPQLCDMVLDRARFQEELRVAEITGSRFLPGLCPGLHRRRQPSDPGPLPAGPQEQGVPGPGPHRGRRHLHGRASARGGPGRPRPCRPSIRPRASKLRRRPAA